MKIRLKKGVELSVIVFIIGGIIGVFFLSMVIREILISGKSSSLFHFAAMHLAGYLFFIFAPVEFLYVFMFRSGGNFFVLFPLAVLTGLFGHLIDYLTGRSVSKVFIKHIIGERRYEKTKHQLHKYGNMLIFITSLFPMSSPVIVLVSGMIKHRYNQVLLYAFTGLILKYIAISLFFV